MGEPPESAWQKYQEAVEAGAEIIIGPLTREAAAQFTERPSLPVPLLLLNQPGDDFTSTAQVIQFALKPEHETAQVAHLAYTRGHRRAAIMAPRSSLGDRLASAFNHQFTQQGGHVISVQHYAPAATDFQVLLRRILARNVDMLFLVASPEQARMIQPQLRYLHEQDPDLEGIIFPEMPAMLSRQGAQGDDRRLLHGNPAWPHLVAMGIDAFTLIPELDRLQRDPQATHTGLTGHLSLDSQGRLVREFDWAHFRNGRPAPLQAHQDGS
jgi:outer membrane PBP1 activator LpoA protein